MAPLLLLLLLVTTTTMAQQHEEDNNNDVLQSCAGDEDCAERRVVAMVDALDNHTAITLLPGVVTLVKVTPVNLTSEELEEGLASVDLDERVDRFLRTHQVHVILGDVDVDLGLDALRSPREADSQGRGKLRRLLIPFLLLLKFVMALVVPLFMHAISMISLKAMWDGLAAIIVASVLYLQGLVNPESSGPSSRISIGVGRPAPPPPPPYYYHHHPDYLHGWNRAGAAPASYDSYRPLRR